MIGVSIGTYIPNDSFVHKMDPRAKIISMVILMIAIFVNSSFTNYLIIGVFILAILVLSKTSLWLVFNSLKVLWLMFFILLIMNSFMYTTGPILFTWDWGFIFPVHTKAIVRTIYIVSRIALVICITTILSSSTKPLDLTLGLEMLLKPLNYLKVPVHIFAMIISIALRFIPTLTEETERIIKAQASRGLDFENGNFIVKIKGITALIIPLLISSFNKADDLALAMEARNYDPEGVRTKYRTLAFSYRDVIAISVLMLSLIFLFLKTNSII